MKCAAQGWLPLAPAVLFLALFFVAPVAALLSLSFTDPAGGFSLASYARLFATATIFRSLLTTVSIAFWTALIAVVIGYPVAYLIATTRASWGRLLLLCVLIPYWSGLLVRTFSWMTLLSRTGPLNTVLLAAGVVDGPVKLIFNMTGVMIGMVNGYTPMAVLLMVTVLQGIDLRLAKAAATMGAGTGQIFWRVTLPLSLPAVTAAGLMIFIASLGTFITPALLGSGRELMIAQLVINQVNEVLNWRFAGAIAALLLAATVVILLIYNRVFGMAGLIGGAAQRGRKPSKWGGKLLQTCGTVSDRLERAPPFRWINARVVLWGVVIAVLLFLIVPSLFVIPISFTGGEFIEWPPRGFSLRWYEQVLGSRQWLDAGVRSLLVGAASACLSVALAVPAAFAFVQAKFRGKGPLLAFVLSPMIVPQILIGVALFFAYAKVGLVGTEIGLVLGHTLICLPYAVISLMAILTGYDRRLDDAAGTMGAGLWQRFTRITAPLIYPGLAAALLIAFITSFEELTIALFITGGITATLPKQLWSELLMTVSPALAVVSTLMLGFVTLSVVFVQLLRARAARIRRRPPARLTA